ncbi:MAG: hypothetical protein A2W23_05140 [Planctomycetes bacterium RBG_16_43_13]|nr:MAG: hypothetical protein A2W23_05140 [Planctomycetes bacterium RBG_16_43_13]
MKVLKWLWMPLIIALLVIIVISNLRTELSIPGFFELNSFYKVENNYLGLPVIENQLKFEEIRQKIAPFNDPQLYLGLAEETRCGGLIGEAIKEYKRAIELDPKSYIPYVGIVLIYFYEWQNQNDISEKKQISLQLLIAIERGIKADQQNAFYNYIRGYLYISEGTETDDSEIGISIKDKYLVEKGLNEITIGNKKDHYDEYGYERYRAIITMWERMDVKIEAVYKIVKVAFTFLVTLSDQIYAAKALNVISKQYEGEGNYENAKLSLEAVSQMGKKLAQKSRYIVSLLVANIVQGIGEDALKEYYTRREMWKEVSYCENRKAQRKELIEQYRSVRNSELELAKLGTLDYILMPGSSYISYDPAIGRQIDYGLIEEILLGCVFILIVALLVIILINWLWTSSCIRKHQLPSIKLSWQIKDIAIIYSVFVTPLLFYILYDRGHYIRNYGLGYLRGLVLVQVVTVILLSVVLLLLLTGKRLSQKITGDAITSTSPTAIKLKRYSMLTYLGLALLLSYFWIGTNWRNELWGALMVIPGIIALILTIIGWYLTLGQAKSKGEMHLVYQRRILYIKSLIPILGGGLIILMLLHLTIAQPYFRRAIKVYETTVIDRMAEDEIGMTNWKTLRDLKD